MTTPSSLGPSRQTDPGPLSSLNFHRQTEPGVLVSTVSSRVYLHLYIERPSSASYGLRYSVQRKGEEFMSGQMHIVLVGSVKLKPVERILKVGMLNSKNKSLLVFKICSSKKKQIAGVLICWLQFVKKQ